MIELILLIILILSFLGIGVILYRKIPVLVKLPEPTGDLPKAVILRVKEKVKGFPVIRNYELYLQKILSRIRVLTLKTDSKTSHWLERLRQKKNQENDNNNDKYWEELKKAKDGK